MRALKVAVIDDDAQQLDVMTHLLRLEDLDVLPVWGPLCSWLTLKFFRPHVVLVEKAEQVTIMRREVPTAKCILFSYDVAEKLRRAQLESGADAAMLKSTPMKQIVLKIKSYEDA